MRKWREGGDKGKAKRLQSSKISRGGEYSVEVSRTIGWTMMNGEEPKESEADAAAFLPATVKAELKISTKLNMSSLHKMLCFPPSGHHHSYNRDKTTRKLHSINLTDIWGRYLLKIMPTRPRECAILFANSWAQSTGLANVCKLIH